MSLRPTPLVCLAFAVFVCLGRLAAAESPTATRAAFLALIARPAVALAPQLQSPVEKDGRLHLAFSYAADADQRVPAILVKPAAAPKPSASPRRPVVISLHGTGGNKEGQVKLLTQFADAGFVGVSIDGRYHGARAKNPKTT
eukprot:gene57707-79066_t